jgi:S-adenosylmethionine decarboxylase proenzyme
MFKNRLSSGKHMICDIQNIKNITLLNDKNSLKQILRNICNSYNFEILGELDHSFKPEGCTIIFLLSESHISIHTFPERFYISFDIYTCRQYKDNKEYNKIFDYLKRILQASSNSECRIIDRNFINLSPDTFDMFGPFDSY